MQYSYFSTRTLVFATLIVSLAVSLGINLTAAQANDLSISPATQSAQISPSASGTEPLNDALPSGNLFDNSTDYSLSYTEDEQENFDVWDRIRRGFGIPDLNNPLVATHTTWYSSRPEYLQRTTQRASRYLFHVVQELERRNMPMELALLPFVESAFNPQAYSSAKAAGIWQFIPSTGLDYNLKQNAFSDERRNVVASTHAALNYLQRLFTMFGDWQLALAAYNWGEGSVSRALAKADAAGRPRDFNSLSAYMPAETRNYYPKLQAIKNIIAAPAQYNIKLPVVVNQPYFVAVPKARDIDIKLAAQLAELPMDEFRALNPQFNRPLIPGGPATSILLPEPNAEKFKTNLAAWTEALSSWTAHKVTAARERIETIAAKFRTTPEVIREANAIAPNMRLKAGSTVLVPKIPTSSEKNIATELVDNAMVSVEPDVPDRKRINVKVGKKETLLGIARRHKVTMAQLREWNNLQKDSLTPGQSLSIEVPIATAAKAGKKKASTSKTASTDKKSQNGATAPRAQTKTSTSGKSSAQSKGNARDNLSTAAR